MSDLRQRRGGVPEPDEHKIVSTPEGDNEYPPGVPIGPAEGLQVSNGTAPTVYDANKPSHPNRPPNASDDPVGEHTDSTSEATRTVDKLSLGQILT